MNADLWTMRAGVGTIRRMLKPIPSTVVLFVAFTLNGCGIPKTVNDARLWICDNIGDDQRVEMEQQAQRVGMTWDQFYTAWRVQCLIRMKQAEAEAAGAIGSIGATKATP